MWNRRQTTKFNGVSYPVQRAAEAVYTEEGQVQVHSLIDYYLDNASVIRKAFEELGYECNGGENSPYVWIKTPKDSWEFFDLLLEKANIVCTPGSGFGRCGNGYIRISSFNSQEKVKEAVNRIKIALG
jgi:LL-diaminopimelate aminotransferase